ncbi:MAG TPA: pilus assembly protein N-terminal domain-containing protein [Candidatus Dormibacteraeota bacterium]|nr:pilus assembly protein N-terminal domain-containing protein [Candidatus Dormibacteraeota bacterium]
MAAATVAALFLILGVASSPPPPAFAKDVTFISLDSGHSVVVPIAGLSRVAVGDGAIAGVVPIGTTQLVINAKSPGHTSVIAWAKGKRLDYEVTVTNQSLDDVSQMLRAAIMDPGVQVVSFGHSIVVRGTVSDMAHFVDLNDIISRFDGAVVSAKSGGEKYKIVNAVTVAESLGSIQAEFAKDPGVSGLQVEPDGKGNVIVSGVVRDRMQAEQVLQRATTLAGPYLAVKGTVVDRLQVTDASQIDIKVYVLEVDRTALSQLGIRLQSATPNDPIHPQFYTFGQPSFPITENGGSGGTGKALNIGPFFRTTLLAPTLDLILQSGHARVLSAPNLVTLPGRKATFLVGGQIPYVYSTGLGQVSVVFKDYGVQLNVTPQIMPNGSIDTEISPDISNLDYQNAVQLNGYYIPALKESKLSTEIITKSGQSVIMGGLLNRVQQRTIQKIPLLSSIPILGKLFQSTSYQTGETDVVFVMTPQIITQ